MEIGTGCRQDDLACVMGELLERWERRQAEVKEGETDPFAGRDCLRCLLEDWD